MIHRLGKALALAGGAIITSIALLAVVSIAGRWLFGATIAGDFELVQVACAIGVAAFLPYCQLQRGNIIVDFFTTNAKRETRARLDAIGALVVAAVMAVLAWRTAAGALSAKQSGEATMIIDFPIWVAYAAIAPSLAVAALAGLYTALQSWRQKDGE